MRKLIDADRFRALHREREAMGRLELGNAALVADTDNLLMGWLGSVANRIVVDGVGQVRDEMEQEQIGAFDQVVLALATFASVRHSTVEIKQQTEAIDAELERMGRR